MFMKAMKLALLFTTAGAIAIGSPASADNINTSGTICHNFNASEALDIDYFSTGAENVATTARTIVCAIPRSPLNATPSPTFFVDGRNNANTSTFCTVTVYDFMGNSVASTSFTESATTTQRTWDHSVTMSPQPGFFDYASVVCTIPASRGGRIFGATAVQP